MPDAPSSVPPVARIGEPAVTSFIRIGVVGPLTGPQSEHGALLMEAASRGLVAARTTAPGLRIALEAADDRNDPEFAMIAARSLLGSGVHAVIGHCDSDAATAAAPLYRDASVPLLITAATRPLLAAQTGGLRLCPSARTEIDALCDALAPHARIAVASERATHGRRLEALLLDDPRMTGRVSGLGRLDDAEPPSGEVVVLLGTHECVLDALYRWRGGGGRYLACGACSLPAFLDTCPDGLAVSVAMPTPDFPEATRRAVLLVAEHAAGGLDGLRTRILSDEGFENGEAKGARYRVEPITPFAGTPDAPDEP